MTTKFRFYKRVSTGDKNGASRGRLRILGQKLALHMRGGDQQPQLIPGCSIRLSLSIDRLRGLRTSVEHMSRR